MSRWNHLNSSRPTFWATRVMVGPHDILSMGQGLCLITFPVRVECPHGLTCCRTLSKGSALARSSTLSPVSSLHCSVKSNVSGLTRHLWSFPTCEGEFEHFTGQIVAWGSFIHWTNTTLPPDPPRKVTANTLDNKTNKNDNYEQKHWIVNWQAEANRCDFRRSRNYTAFPRVQRH